MGTLTSTITGPIAWSNADPVNRADLDTIRKAMAKVARSANRIRSARMNKGRDPALHIIPPFTGFTYKEIQRIAAYFRSPYIGVR